MRNPTWIRPLGAVLALTLVLASPTPPVGAAPDGQVTWAVHVSITPTWFDPDEHPGIVTGMIFYARHDNGVGPRVDEAGLGLIEHHPYSSPYEDLKLKAR